MCRWMSGPAQVVHVSACFRVRNDNPEFVSSLLATVSSLSNVGANRASWATTPTKPTSVCLRTSEPPPKQTNVPWSY
jgi:hypothetical protein